MQYGETFLTLHKFQDKLFYSAFRFKLRNYANALVIDHSLALLNVLLINYEQIILLRHDSRVKAKKHVELD